MNQIKSSSPIDEPKSTIELALSIGAEAPDVLDEDDTYKFSAHHLQMFYEAIKIQLLKLTSVKDNLPPDGVYVMTRRRSGYTTTQHEFMTAKFMADYKGWTDVGNTRLLDSGEDPTHWRFLYEDEIAEQVDIEIKAKANDTYSF